jgi:hypothetical protein
MIKRFVNIFIEMLCFFITSCVMDSIGYSILSLQTLIILGCLCVITIVNYVDGLLGQW